MVYISPVIFVSLNNQQNNKSSPDYSIYSFQGVNTLIVADFNTQD